MEHHTPAGFAVRWAIDVEVQSLLASMGRGWKRRMADLARTSWQEEVTDVPLKVAIVFVSEARILELNADFRKKTASTDVLTFNLSDSPEYIEGEIYICPEVASRQMHLFREKALAGSLTKRADRNDLELEIARLVLHGVLHLAGHDHHTLADGRRMASATRRYLRPFALQHSPSA